jgi:hypothetical protein
MMVLLAAAWFSVVQATPHKVSLRGCAECAGEPDDVCEVRPGAQTAPLDDVPLVANGRFRLLRPSAEAACAVPLAKALAKLDIAAVRMAQSPPSAALVEAVKLRAVHGWPSRKNAAAQATPDRSALRLAYVCPASEKAWPVTKALGPCDFWLLAVNAAGEPDVSATSFQIANAPKWEHALDRDAVLDESLFVSAPPKPAVVAAKEKEKRTCADAAREQTATLDRFDQWDAQIRKAPASSLNRATLTLGATRWTGHCQELEVLRAALEKQLDCAVAVEGVCE